MSDFVRTYQPESATFPEMLPGLDSKGRSGKSQLRSIIQLGRSWKETYGTLESSNTSTQLFLGYLNNLWRNRIIFTLSHPDMLIPHGATITGTIVVNGANQIGDTLTVTPSSLSAILKAYDIISITSTGLNHVFDLTEDMTSVNDTTLKLNPPLITGLSPADGSNIVYTGVKFRCYISDITFPELNSNGWYQGLEITFQEAP